MDHALAQLLTTKVNDHVINHAKSVTVKECYQVVSDLQTQKPKMPKEKLCIVEAVNTARVAQVVRLQSDMAQTTTVVYQMAEVACVKEHVPISLLLQLSLGLTMKRGNADTMNKVGGKNFFHFSILKQGNKERKPYLTGNLPCIDLKSPLKEIWQHTAFYSIDDSLLAFIFLVGNESIEKRKERKHCSHS